MLVGIGLIMAAVGTLLSLVLKKGWCLIYLQTAKDLDVSAVEAEMQAKLAQVRAQAQAARERVQQQNLATRHGVSRRRWIRQPAGRMMAMTRDDRRSHEPFDSKRNADSRRYQHAGLGTEQERYTADAALRSACWHRTVRTTCCLSSSTLAIRWSCRTAARRC